MMPSHLRSSALSVVLWFSYYHALIFGLLPTLVDFKRPLHLPRHTLYYHLYSFVVHLLCFTAILIIMPRTLTGMIYLKGWLSVCFSVSFSLICKTIALGTMYAFVWFGRRRAADVLRCYHALRQNYQHLQRKTSQMQQRLEWLLLAKFCSGYMAIIYSLRISLIINKDYSIRYMLLTLSQCLANTMLISCLHQFVFALYLLRRQFVCLNETLREWLMEVVQLQEIKGSAETQKVVNYKCLRSRLVDLTAMHFGYQCLAVRVFSLFALPFAGLLLHEVSVGINMLFSGVQFITKRINAGSKGKSNGSILIAVSYIDALLLMASVNGVVSECNAVSEWLRECTALLGDGKARAELAQELDAFAIRLSCQRLRFHIFGLFELNRGAFLKCLLCIFVYVTVLMQFDMNLRQV